MPSLSGLLLLLMVLCGSTAIAAEDPADPSAIKVLVMPFQINAQNDLSNLRTQIPGVLAQRLQKEGALPVTIDESAVEEALKITSGNLDDIRNKALAEGAQQVVWGSFTLIGTTFSLDMRLMSAQAGAAPERFFSQGQNLESLVPVVNDLADQIGTKLFGRQLDHRYPCAGKSAHRIGCHIAGDQNPKGQRLQVGCALH